MSECDSCCGNGVDIDAIDFDDDQDTQAFMASYREKRLVELQQSHTTECKDKRSLEEADHGQYIEVDEKDFLRITTSEKRVVCHFHHPQFTRCKILDGHLEALAKKHYRVKFIKINAETAPFIIERMKIRVLPCLVVFLDAIAVDRVVGFEELGNTDTFRTEVLEHRLSKSGVLILPKKSSNMIGQHSNSTAVDEDSDDD